MICAVGVHYEMGRSCWYLLAAVLFSAAMSLPDNAEFRAVLSSLSVVAPSESADYGSVEAIPAGYALDGSRKIFEEARRIWFKSSGQMRWEDLSKKGHLRNAETLIHQRDRLMYLQNEYRIEKIEPNSRIPGRQWSCTRTAAAATIPRMAIKITDPSYISEHMLDKIVKEKFHDNADDAAVRDQAIKFLQMFRASTTRDQTIVDILHPSRISRRDFKEGIAEIGFTMGMQFGFELALSFPPLQKK